MMSEQIPENTDDFLSVADINALSNGTNIWVMWRTQGPYLYEISDTSVGGDNDVWVLRSRLVEAGIGVDVDSVRVWL